MPALCSSLRATKWGTRNVSAAAIDWNLWPTMEKKVGTKGGFVTPAAGCQQTASGPLPSW